MIVTNYAKEVVPPEIYSRYNMVISLGLLSGQVLCLLLGVPVKYVTSFDYWRVAVGFSILFPALRAASMLYYKPRDSPFFFLENSSIFDHDQIKKQQTLKSLEEIYKLEEIEVVYSEILKDLGIKKSSENHQKELQFDQDFENNSDSIEPQKTIEPPKNQSTFSLLSTHPHLKITILGFWLFVTQQFSGLNAINFYSKNVFEEIGSKEYANLLAAAYGIFDFFVVIFAGRYVANRFNRRTLMIRGYYMVSLVLLLFAFLESIHSTAMAVVMLFVFLFTFNMFANIVLWAVLNEMVHPKLINLCVSGHWICCVFIA